MNSCLLQCCYAAKLMQDLVLLENSCKSLIWNDNEPQLTMQFPTITLTARPLIGYAKLRQVCGRLDNRSINLLLSPESWWYCLSMLNYPWSPDNTVVCLCLPLGRHSNTCYHSVHCSAFTFNVYISQHLLMPLTKPININIDYSPLWCNQGLPHIYRM